MTVETAERARDILAEIRRLKNMIEQLEACDIVTIRGCRKLETHFEVECSKSNSRGMIVKHIINGLERDIQELEEELGSL